MRRAVATAVLAAQLAGCFTYAINVDEPKGETVLILAGVDVAAGLTGGIAATLAQGKFRNLMENVGIGILGALVVDLVVGLGLGTSDFVGE